MTSLGWQSNRGMTVRALESRQFLWVPMIGKKHQKVFNATDSRQILLSMAPLYEARVRCWGWFCIIAPSKMLRPLISAVRSNDSMGNVAAKRWLAPNFGDFGVFSKNFFHINFWNFRIQQFSNYFIRGVEIMQNDFFTRNSRTRNTTNLCSYAQTVHPFQLFCFRTKVSCCSCFHVLWDFNGFSPPRWKQAIENFVRNRVPEKTA